MKIRPIAALALAVALPIGAVACSDDSSGSLDRDQLLEDLEQQGFASDEASCVADGLADADFTQEDYDAVTGTETDGVDVDKVQTYGEVTNRCLGLPDIGGS